VNNYRCLKLVSEVVDLNFALAFKTEPCTQYCSTSNSHLGSPISITTRHQNVVLIRESSTSFLSSITCALISVPSAECGTPNSCPTITTFDRRVSSFAYHRTTTLCLPTTGTCISASKYALAAAPRSHLVGGPNGWYECDRPPRGRGRGARKDRNLRVLKVVI
jgi:hypothetical protein